MHVCMSGLTQVAEASARPPDLTSKTRKLNYMLNAQFFNYKFCTRLYTIVFQDCFTIYVTLLKLLNSVLPGIFIKLVVPSTLPEK
jgi:hypothetical protein